MAKNATGQATASKEQDPKAEDASAKNQTSHGGRGWHGDPQGHAEAGRKGGKRVSENKQHMAEIGRKGGIAASQDRAHMAEIGRKGGMQRGRARA
jgi:general stress protein YciG